METPSIPPRHIERPSGLIVPTSIKKKTPATPTTPETAGVEPADTEPTAGSDTGAVPEATETEPLATIDVEEPVIAGGGLRGWLRRRKAKRINRLETRAHDAELILGLHTSAAKKFSKPSFSPKLTEGDTEVRGEDGKLHHLPDDVETWEARKKAGKPMLEPSPSTPMSLPVRYEGKDKEGNEKTDKEGNKIIYPVSTQQQQKIVDKTRRQRLRANKLDASDQEKLRMVWNRDGREIGSDEFVEQIRNDPNMDSKTKKRALQEHKRYKRLQATINQLDKQIEETASGEDRSSRKLSKKADRNRRKADRVRNDSGRIKSSARAAARTIVKARQQAGLQDEIDLSENHSNTTTEDQEEQPPQTDYEAGDDYGLELNDFYTLDQLRQAAFNVPDDDILSAIEDHKSLLQDTKDPYLIAFYTAYIDALGDELDSRKLDPHQRFAWQKEIEDRIRAEYEYTQHDANANTSDLPTDESNDQAEDSPESAEDSDSRVNRLLDASRWLLNTVLFNKEDSTEPDNSENDQDDTPKPDQASGSEDAEASGPETSQDKKTKRKSGRRFGRPKGDSRSERTDLAKKKKKQQFKPILPPSRRGGAIV